LNPPKNQLKGNKQQKWGYKCQKENSEITSFHWNNLDYAWTCTKYEQRSWKQIACAKMKIIEWEHFIVHLWSVGQLMNIFTNKLANVNDSTQAKVYKYE